MVQVRENSNAQEASEHMKGETNRESEREKEKRLLAVRAEHMSDLPVNRCS